MKIAPLIYKTLEQDNKQWVPKNHNPSSASFKYSDGRVIGKDMLSLYLKWTGVPPSNPITAKALLNMRMGDATHEALAKILAKAGIKAKSEVKGEGFVPGLKNKISYRVDGLCELDGNIEVLEVKSTTDDAMMSSGWGIIDTGPKEDHILQLVCYLNLEPGVKAGRLIYVSRDTGELLEYRIERDGDKYFYSGSGAVIPEISFSGIVARWAELEKRLENQEMPEPEFRPWLNDDGEIMKVKQIKGKKYKTPWQCMYDSYKDYIWKNPANYKFTMNAQFELSGYK